MAKRFKKITGVVGAAVIGEGATSTGAFHEAINQAAVEKLPLVLVIVPSPIDACVAYDWQVDIAKYPNYDRRMLSDAVAETSRRLDALYVNLFDSFAGV